MPGLEVLDKSHGQIQGNIRPREFINNKMLVNPKLGGVRIRKTEVINTLKQVYSFVSMSLRLWNSAPQRRLTRTGPPILMKWKMIWLWKSQWWNEIDQHLSGWTRTDPKLMKMKSAGKKKNYCNFTKIQLVKISVTSNHGAFGRVWCQRTLIT